MEIAELPMDGERAEELRGHLADAMAAHQQEGLTEEEASERAIADFGDVEIVGRQLREVTPLPVSWREWGLWGTLVVGAVAWSRVPWGLFFPAALRHVYVLWLPIFIGTGFLASRLRQPLLAALAPLTAGLLIRTWMGMYIWFWSLERAQAGLSNPPEILWLYMVQLPYSPSFLLFLPVLLGVCLIGARLRHIQLFAVTRERMLACVAHLLPFLCLVIAGMWAWVPAIGIVTTIWLYGRRHATFVERHALQAAVVSLFFVALLLGVQQYYLYPWPTGIPASFLVIGGWMTIRFAFASVLLYAALAALSGHDFRYPFARLLFRGRRVRHA